MTLRRDSRPAHAQATVANLLEHTDGLFDCALAQFYNFGSSDADLPAIDFFNRFPELRRSWWRPGDFYSYSNAGYVVAGYLIQKTSGRPYDEYLQHEILMPLGMIDTSGTLRPAIAKRMATGYAGAGRAAVAYRPAYQGPGAALISSPAEMAQLVRMLLDGGSFDGKRMLSRDSVERMQTPRTSAQAHAGEQLGYARSGWAPNSSAADAFTATLAPSRATYRVTSTYPRRGSAISLHSTAATLAQLALRRD